MQITIAQRAFQHFEANVGPDGMMPNMLPDIVQELREEFPRRKISPAYVKACLDRFLSGSTGLLDPASYPD